MKTMVALSAVAVALEAKAQPYIAAALGSRLPAATPLVLPAAYAGVVLVNVVAASFALIKLGMAVGKARKQYKVEVRRRAGWALPDGPSAALPHRPALTRDGGASTPPCTPTARRRTRWRSTACSVATSRRAPCFPESATNATASPPLGR